MIGVPADHVRKHLEMQRSNLRGRSYDAMKSKRPRSGQSMPRCDATGRFQIGTTTLHWPGGFISPARGDWLNP